MAWKKVFDNEQLLSSREYKIAEKFVEKDDRSKAIFFTRNMIYTAEKYNICSGVVCEIEWDEICDFTEPHKCFLIIDNNIKKVVAYTNKLNKNKDNIIYILKTPFKLNQQVCTDMASKNGIFNLNNEKLIPQDSYLKYDKEDNIYTEETIKVTKRTYFKDGIAQSPTYSGHEEIIK